jgi:hypothetical protein
MIMLQYRRMDGSFVATVRGMPYHITASDPRFQQAVARAQSMGDALPYEPLPQQPTETLRDYEDAIQGLVDATARSKQYHDGVTMASYANSTIPQWAAEATTFIAWRDAVWVYTYQELAKFEGGLRTPPGVASFLTELPAINWG